MGLQCSFFRVGLLLIVFGSFIGCSSLPVEDLRLYASAFQQARDAGDLLLDEISPIVSGASGAAGGGCQLGPSGYPECFDPRQVAGRDGLRANEDVSIRVRRAALETIAIFNGILVDLAEGKSVNEMQSRIDRLASFATVTVELGGLAAGGLPALIGPGAALARGLVARLERARANAAARDALIASKGDIQQLLQLLAQDTPHLYRIYKAAREKDLINLNHERNLARLSGDDAVRARAEARMAAVRESIAAYHAGMAAYVRLLNETSKALDVLAAAAQQPSVSTDSLVAVAREAVLIRREADDFWNAVRAVRRERAGAI